MNTVVLNQLLFLVIHIVIQKNNYKLTNYTWPIVPPYYQGRFSNYRNWVDRLTNFKILSYAYGSATTDNNFVQGYAKLNTVPVPGVRQQIKIYLNNTRIKNINFEKTLYIIWAGGNDFLFNPLVTINAIINSLMNSVRDLLAIGAKHIIVFNQVPNQALPINSKRNITSFFYINY